MTNAARVEILHEGTTDRFHYWQNRSGSLRLFRRRETDDWVAQVDGRVVLEREEIEDNVHLISSRALSASSAENLVALLSMQENVHAILDVGQAWGRGDAALELEAREDAPVESDEIAE